MWKFFKDWTIPLLIGIAFSVYIATTFGLADVVGHSMEPTLTSGDQVIFNRREKIRHDDVIIFNATGVDPTDQTGDYYVKRVIGVPGDVISYQANGQLVINGKNVGQDYISQQQQQQGTLSVGDNNYANGFTLQELADKQNWTYKPVNNVIPKGYYFVMGDNRAVSNDSRYWGLVPIKKISGVAKLTSSFTWIN